MKKYKRNIIFITNLHIWSLDAGKGGKAFYHTISSYLRAGWKVHLVTSGGGIPADIIGNITIHEKYFERLNLWCNSTHRPVSILSRYIKYCFQTVFYFFSALALIKKNYKEDFVVYAYEVEAVKAAYYLSKLFRFPLVTRFQGTILGSETFGWFNRIKKIPHFEALSTKADLVIMTNDGTKGLEILNRLKNRSKKIVFWRNGVDKIPAEVMQKRIETRRILDINSDMLVFIVVSRLVWWKRVHLAVDGFAKINTKYPNTRLIIVGDGPDKKSIVNKAQENGVYDKIVFTGSVEQEKVKYFLSAADVFLSYYELSNLGNPIMEAMMVGLPIITIDVGDTRMLIRNEVNGILIPGDKLEQIPYQMERMLIDKELREKLAKGSLITAQTEFWSWEERMDAELNAVETLFTNV